MLDAAFDLDSDFSVFHGIGNYLALPSRAFLAYASRLHCYDGAVRQFWRGRARAEVPTKRETPSSTASVEDMRMRMRAEQYGHMRNADGTPVWDGQVEWVGPELVKDAVGSHA